MYYEEILNNLNNTKQKIAVTLTLDTYPKYCPRYKQNRILLKNLITRAAKQLVETYGKREAALLVEKVKNIPEKVLFSGMKYGLAVFVSEQVLEIIYLPFPPSNKIKISDTFYTRAIIRKLSQSEHYYILAISQKQVRLFEAYNNEIIEEIKDGGFPFANTTPPPYADSYTRSQAGAADKLSQKFFREVNQQLQLHYDHHPLPIVLAGTVENIANYYDVVSERKLVIGAVNGNFDDHDGTDLKTLVKLAVDVVREYQESHYLQAFDIIQDARKRGLVEKDLGSIYAAAKRGQVRELVVQEDHYIAGFITREGLFSYEDGKDSKPTEDIVNHIVHHVIQCGGDVTFVPPFYFNKEKAKAVLRWKEDVKH